MANYSYEIMDWFSTIIGISIFSIIYFSPLHIYTLISCRNGIANILKFIVIWLFIYYAMFFPLGYFSLILGGPETISEFLRFILFIHLFLIAPALIDILIYFKTKKLGIKEVINNVIPNVQEIQQVNPQQPNTIPTPPIENLTPSEITTEIKQTTLS